MAGLIDDLESSEAKASSIPLGEKGKTGPTNFLNGYFSWHLLTKSRDFPSSFGW